MTSRLSLLRSRLARLRGARMLLRAVAAVAGVGCSMIVACFFVFVVDFFFRLGTLERLTVMSIAAGAIGWSFWRYAWPLVSRRESLTETALFVERRQQIDGDLVAALEFDSTSDRGLESPRLADAVVNYVSAATPDVHFLDGAVPSELPRRLTLLAACLFATGMLVMVAPRHAAVFWQRMCLSAAQYPTRTHVERVFVNHALVFDNGRGNASLVDCKAPQGRPLQFFVECSGQLPTKGTIDLAAAGNSSRQSQLQLALVSMSQRQAWLRDAAARIADVLQSPPAEVSPQLKEELAALVQCDAPRAIQPLLAAERTTDLASVLSAIDKASRDFAERAGGSGFYQGDLRHLNDDLKYRITIGDAATSRAAVKLIPLPLVQLEIIPRLPSYARTVGGPGRSPGSAGVVLEGSAVEALLTCSNKPLKAVWMTMDRGETRERISFVALDEARRMWRPSPTGLLVKRLSSELRYELQVVDDDGLSLESPIRGVLRAGPDKLPTAIAKVVHKLVVPTATPVISYQAEDDFGISRLTLAVEIERQAASESAISSTSDRSQSAADESKKQQPPTIETHRMEVLRAAKPPANDAIPVQGAFSLPLEPLKLKRGDRLKLVLEAMDYRGEDESGAAVGLLAASEPVALEVADEAAVIAAIAEADKRTQQQLSEIIERQLSREGERQ